MAFRCSRAVKVKEQPRPQSSTTVRAGASSDRGRDSKPCDARNSRNGRVTVQRSSSVPLTVTEQRRHELRERRMRELENYPYQNTKGKNGSGERKERGGLLSSIFTCRTASTDDVRFPSTTVDGKRGFDSSYASLDSTDPQARSRTILIDDFEVIQREADGTTKVIHVVSPVLPRPTSGGANTTGVPSPGTMSLGSLGSNSIGKSTSAALHGYGSINNDNYYVKTPIPVTTTNSASRRRVPPPQPTLIPENQGYYIYERMIPCEEEGSQAMQKVRVRSNRPPRRAKSLDEMRPEPIHLTLR